MQEEGGKASRSKGSVMVARPSGHGLEGVKDEREKAERGEREGGGRSGVEGEA